MRNCVYVVLIAMWACGDPSSVQQSVIHDYFDLDSLLDAQIEFLADQSLPVDKKVRINDSTEWSRLTFTLADWKEELNPVRDLDLNLPIYVGAIRVEEMDQTIKYFPAPGQDINIQYVHYRFDENGNIAHISGSFLDDNARRIYTTERTISLHFENNQLVSYQIQGYQKMVTRDTTYFEVSGEVNR